MMVQTTGVFIESDAWTEAQAAPQRQEKPRVLTKQQPGMQAVAAHVEPQHAQRVAEPAASRQVALDRTHEVELPAQAFVEPRAGRGEAMGSGRAASLVDSQVMPLEQPTNRVQNFVSSAFSRKESVLASTRRGSFVSSAVLEDKTTRRSGTRATRVRASSSA